MSSVGMSSKDANCLASWLASYLARYLAKLTATWTELGPAQPQLVFFKLYLVLFFFSFLTIITLLFLI
jgi:hypothetical protein